MTHSALSKISRRSFLTAATALSAAAVLRPAFAADPIKIGFGMSLTGPNSPAGKMFLVAREVWKDEVNQKGGIFGRPVEFVYYDDQSNPSLVPSLYSKLLDVDKVDLLLSGFSTNQIAPAMPIVMARKKLFLGLFGTGVNDHFKYDRYFQILPNGPEGNASLSEGFFKTALTLDPKPQTVALVGEDTEFGHNILIGARENAARAGFWSRMRAASALLVAHLKLPSSLVLAVGPSAPAFRKPPAIGSCPQARSSIDIVAVPGRGFGGGASPGGRSRPKRGAPGCSASRNHQLPLSMSARVRSNPTRIVSTLSAA